MEQPKFYSLDFEDENKAMPPDSVLAVYRYFRIATLVLMGIGFIPLVPTLLLLWTFFSEGLGFTQILTGESVRDLIVLLQDSLISWAVSLVLYLISFGVKNKFRLVYYFLLIIYGWQSERFDGFPGTLKSRYVKSIEFKQWFAL